MVLIAVIGICYLYLRRLNVFNVRTNLVIHSLVFIAVYGMILYITFLENAADWEYGIPGADMLAHFDGARALANGSNWSQLNFFAARFEEVGLGTIGYFLYTQLLSWMLFRPILLDVHLNMYLIYMMQCLAIAISAVNLARVLSEINQLDQNKCQATVVILLTCMAFLVTAYQFMRDIWAFLFLTEAYFRICCRPQSLKNSFIIVILIILIELLRPYMVLLLLPFIIYYGFKPQIGYIVSVAILFTLIIYSAAISSLRQMLGVIWSFNGPEVGEMINFILFPSIINQSKLLFSGVFSTNNYLSGVNVPFTDYFQSIWNVFVIPLGLLGAIYKLHEKWREKVMWSCMLVSICLLYSISYDSGTMMLRHKMMIAPTLLYFAQQGVLFLKKHKGWIYSYSYFICLIVIICLFGYQYN